jgi:hypothetical protein
MQPLLVQQAPWRSSVRQTDLPDAANQIARSPALGGDRRTKTAENPLRQKTNFANEINTGLGCPVLRSKIF